MHALIAQLLAMTAAVIAGVLVAERIETPVRSLASRISEGRGRRR
ncbi:hypothetical protein [Methylobacterium dankookense]|uniref:Uncharacterized protein n=1 Tax=Methylobacterium dankookense TaxID=560405 RepID=A0A564FTX6_9HYPH|nr:hypothetical protein [Methylobacterium dankookense]GJD54141.1 hypothetical protein IFDJLNFL_0008 [Methylobacterium dankookense]VUF11130.1 hypothetical protein MTDSW087_00803 [Methylobacterium dankookense]